MPALADVTFLDHRNQGEAAPCLATYEVFSPSQVIQDSPATEQITFNIKLLKDAVLDPQTNKCRVTMTEVVEANIRGFNFVHDRSHEMPNRHPADCR